MKFLHLALPFLVAATGAQAETFGETTIRARPMPNRLQVEQTAQTGQVPPAAQTPDARILANEPDGMHAGITLSFGTDTVHQTTTPLALLQISAGAVVVKDHFTSGSGHMGALHVSLHRPGETEPVLAGSTLMPPRRATPVVTTIDVTAAVNAALSAPGASHHLVFELTLGGKPGYCPVYRLAGPSPYLAIFPPNRTEDAGIAAQRVLPVVSGPTVYREPCLLLTETRGSAVAARLLYPAARIREVIRDLDGKRLVEGRDWTLQNGIVTFPATTEAPVQFGPEFFAAPAPKPGAKPAPAAPRRTLRLEATDETWYRDRQVEITYDPASRDWSWPAPISTLAQLPRLARKFAAHEPIKIVHFGDSISFGHNASSIGAVPPYQPVWGELVAREIERRRGVSVLYLNHSHSGGTGQWGALSADGLVAAEKPDLVILAFGMNDRAPARLATYRANLEAIIDTVRASSPETEFLLVATMMNNPAQPTGSGPVLEIRDITLSIARPGIAFADVTTAEKVLLEHKDYLDLTGNGANHPNDFLIGVYAQRILEVLAPKT